MPADFFDKSLTDAAAAPRKTDYFGTFLKTLSANPAMQGDTDPLNALVKAIAARNGAAAVSDLLAATGNSVSGVLDGVRKLQASGIVTLDGASVRLTDAGVTVAQQLS